MLTLEKQAAKLTSLNARATKNGDKHIPAADLFFTFAASNDVLSEFDPQLKSSLYRKPDSGSEDQQELLDSPGWLPKLRFPKLEGLKWHEEIKGGTVTIHHGRSEVVLEVKSADGFKFEPMDGGSVNVSFRVQCHPDEKQVGKLFGMIQEEVELSLQAPPASDTPWPFPNKDASTGTHGLDAALTSDGAI